MDGCHVFQAGTNSDLASRAKWRAAEMKTMKEMRVYRYVPMDVARSDPDGIIIDTTWVDNADKEKSRLCAREFNSTGPRDDLFAGTPPLLATKFLISECATRARGQGCRMMVLDVKRA